MLIRTPETEVALLAKSKKSNKVINFPSSLNSGFRCRVSFAANGSDIEAALREKNNGMSDVIHIDEKHKCTTQTSRILFTRII